MAKKKEVTIEAFEIGKCDSNKSIEVQIKKFNTVLDELPQDRADHIRSKVQPWLDQFDAKNTVEVNSAALHKATSVYNHLTNNLNPE